MDVLETDYLVIGGGISGVSCAELLNCLDDQKKITLITPSSVVKAITDLSPITKLLSSFRVVERKVSDWVAENGRIAVLQGTLLELKPDQKTALVTNIGEIHYDRICLCIGASPKIVHNHPRVLGLRDIQSVENLQERLEHANRVVVVGNGGIATELVHVLDNIEIIWAIRDESINSAFVDACAGDFLNSKLKEGGSKRTDVQAVSKRLKYSVNKSQQNEGSQYQGSALGPDWHNRLKSSGAASVKRVHVEYGCELKDIVERDDLQKQNISVQNPGDDWNKPKDWPIYVKLSSGKFYGCDFVVSATGVVPNGHLFDNLLNVDCNGGIIVDEVMRTSCDCVYAAGDIISPGWNLSEHWVHMKLWTQARQTGMQAAVAMVNDSNGDETTQDFCFEIFAHVTKFFDYKVVLLGLFNGQNMDGYEILVRVTPGHEYVKVILKGGRMQGALLIGDTDLEETFENLILNQLDLSSYGEDLLDPSIDIEDYFD